MAADATVEMYFYLIHIRFSNNLREISRIPCPCRWTIGRTFRRDRRNVFPRHLFQMMPNPRRNYSIFLPTQQSYVYVDLVLRQPACFSWCYSVVPATNSVCKIHLIIHTQQSIVVRLLNEVLRSLKFSHLHHQTKKAELWSHCKWNTPAECSFSYWKLWRNQIFANFTSLSILYK